MMNSRFEGTLVRQLVRERLPGDESNPSNPWMSVMRKEAASWIGDMQVPNRRMEQWRYTPMDFIDKMRFVTCESHDPFDALLFEDIEELLVPGTETNERIVFVNGRYAPRLSRLDQGGGIDLHTLSSGSTLPSAYKRFIGGADLSSHFFLTLNSALFTDGAVIHAAKHTGAPRKIELLHVSVGMPEPVIHNPRHLVLVDEGASLELVERYVSLGNSSYFNNSVIDVVVSRQASLTHTRLQEESDLAHHLAYLTVRLDAGSRYSQAGLSSGAAWSRTEVKVIFEGEDASAELDGLLLAGNRQFNDLHLDVLHQSPNCRSRENFRGLLNGSGRVVFDGRIVVAKDAQKSHAELSNDNLMLSRSAEVDTKPQLEIFADDVKCSHGATVGELDREMLFYLRSRGIPKPEAERMLCRGFAGQVIEAFPESPLREHAGALVEQRLAKE
jgi:Fe-S cluster assembly protein SufD